MLGVHRSSCQLMGPEKKNVKGRVLNSFAILDLSFFIFFFSKKPPSIYLAFWWKTLFLVNSHPRSTIIFVSGCQGRAGEQKTTEDMRNFSRTDGRGKENHPVFVNRTDQRPPASWISLKPLWDLYHVSLSLLSRFSLHSFGVRSHISLWMNVVTPQLWPSATTVNAPPSPDWSNETTLLAVIDQCCPELYF